MNQTNVASLVVMLVVMLVCMLTVGACESRSKPAGPQAPPANRRYPHLAEFVWRLERGERVTIAYFGGSITWGATATDPLKTSWRALVSQHLEEAFSEARIKSVDAAIGGQPSKLGVFRVDRDVLPYEPDLTFVEFAVNDWDAEDTRETMEGIVRKLKASNPKMAVVILVVGMGWDYQSPQLGAHREVAEHYGLPLVDALSGVKKALEGDLTTKDIITDGCHPNDRGYRLLADIILPELDRMRSEPGEAKPFPAEPLTANRYESASMVELSKLAGRDSLGGWKPAQPSITGTWFDQQPSRWQSSAVAPAEAGAALEATLECTGLGVYYEIKAGGGSVVLSADGEEVLEIKTDNQLWEARVQFAFEMLGEPKARRVTLTAPKAEDAKLGNTKVAYLLVTR